MSNFGRTVAKWVIALAAAAPVWPTYAQLGPPTLAEIPALPDACRVRLDQGTPAEWTAWQNRLGRPIWDHFHHYCYGMNFMNRQMRDTTPARRRHNLNQAIKEFNYVLARWPKDHPIYQEALAKRSMAEMFLRMTPR